MNNKADLINGNLWKAMFTFAVPLVITNLLQAIYNISDMIIVGHFAGASGLTAVGNGGQVTMVILNIVLGLANGGAVIVAQMVGSGRRDEVPKVVSTIFLTFMIIGVVVSVAAFACTRPILDAMHTPPEAYSQTVNYLRICVFGTLFVYTYNMMAAILRGMGDSKIPMTTVVITSLLNIGLDLLFVGAFNLNATGAAIATLISQIMSVVIIVPMALHKYPELKITKEGLGIDGYIFKNLFKIGLPQSIQFTLTQLSFTLILGLVNVYGNDAAAAAVSVSRLSSLAVLVGQAMMGAIISVAGQNIGAKQYDRALKSVFVGMAYAYPVSILFFVLSEIKPEWMLTLFTTDPGVIAYGIPYLKVLAISFLVETGMFCMFGLMTGSGYTNYTMVCALLSAFVVRFSLAWYLSTHTSLGFLGIAWAYPFAPVASCIVCVIFLCSGKWKQSRLKMRQQ